MFASAVKASSPPCNALWQLLQIAGGFQDKRPLLCPRLGAKALWSHRIDIVEGAWKRSTSGFPLIRIVVMCNVYSSRAKQVRGCKYFPTSKGSRFRVQGLTSMTPSCTITKHVCCMLVQKYTAYLAQIAHMSMVEGTRLVLSVSDLFADLDHDP